MIPVTMGGLSAVSLGVADFIASQNSERIGAARALGGMLLVSSLLLSILMLIQGGFDSLFVATNIWLILLASLHGATIAIALLLFFHAMTIGKISVVAPIVAAKRGFGFVRTFSVSTYVCSPHNGQAPNSRFKG